MDTAILKSALGSTVAVIGHSEEKGTVVLGSGVAIAKEVVLTSAHVLPVNLSPWSIEVGPDHQYDPAQDFLPAVPCKSFSVDRTRDLLLLRAPGLSSLAAPIRGRPHDQGEDVFWIGHPGPLQPQAAPLVGAGIVSGHAWVRPFPGGPTSPVSGFRFDGTVLAGNSGGGVFDQTGAIVGLVCASPLLLRHPELRLFLKNTEEAEVAQALRTLLRELSTMTQSGVGIAISAAEIKAALPSLITNLVSVPT